MECVDKRVSLMKEKGHHKVANKIEDFFTERRWIFTFIHWTMLLVFLALILIPPFLPYPPESATPGNNFVLFANFIFWGVWFPLLLLSVVFFGRAWCGLMCPQGAMSEYMSKVGLNRRPSRWLTWSGTPVLSFIFVTVMAQVVGVREYPLPMLEVFGGTMVLAIVVGFVFTAKHRTWCRYLCPVGLLLGIFSRLGMVSFEGRMAGKRKGWNTLCPTFIDLSKKRTSRHCIECFKCANWRNPNALKLTFRKPGIEIESIKEAEPALHEVMFLFLATGLALGAFHWTSNPMYIRFKSFLGNLFFDHGLAWLIGKSGPWWLMINYPELGDVFNYLDFISAISFMILFMVGYSLFLSVLNYLSASFVSRRERKEVFTRLGYIYSPVALLSLFLGLGTQFFSSLSAIGMEVGLINGIRLLIFVTGVTWSLYLGYRVIKGEGSRVFLSLIPQVAGIALIAIGWYPMLF